MQPTYPAGCLCLIALTFLASCSQAPSGPNTATPQATGPVTIYTVNYPLQYFAQRIGGEHVKVVFPGPPDTDPAYWMPSPSIIADYQNADLILLNGASYAKWTRTVSLPPSKLVHTSSSFRDQTIDVQEGLTHSHGPSGEHIHEGTAFTTWLDPQLAISQATAIHAELISQRPQYEDEFNQGYELLIEDLEEIDTEIMALVEQKRELPLLFSHPVYQYFTRRYALNAESVHWEPSEMPSEAMWDEFAALRERHPAAWMIWEDEPDAAIVARLREMSVESIVFAPCGNTPSAGDYITLMHANIGNLAKVFGR
jgi:zinc transport system substrate-binding protein